jgi:tRNA (adenine37-N6)-methyltransferase
MMEAMTMQIIARIHNDFPTKFGLPRQSGLAKDLQSVIVFEPEYRVAEALRGMEGFSHLWLVWAFHMAQREKWSPTVRPPRLGGNTRMGVFATRSPFRPNPIGLTCVELKEIRTTEHDGTVLIVSGADMMDGTPILDIKPYIPYADSYPDAIGGFAQERSDYALQVNCPEHLLAVIPSEKRPALLEALAQDPRPAYQHDLDRVYGFQYGTWEVKFSVRDGALTVLDVQLRD